MLKVPADVATVFRLKVDEEQCKHFTWIYLPPTTTPSLNIICRPHVLGDNVCCNSMFVRLGTDYEIRNGGYFESIKNSANQFISKP